MHLEQELDSPSYVMPLDELADLRIKLGKGIRSKHGRTYVDRPRDRDFVKASDAESVTAVLAEVLPLVLASQAVV
jgi:hypothetical protein